MKKLIILFIEIVIFLFFSISMIPFESTRVKWAKRDVPYYYALPYGWIEHIDTAAKTWNNANPGNFTFRNAGVHAQIQTPYYFEQEPRTGFDIGVNMLDKGRITSSTEEDPNINPIAQSIRVLDGSYNIIQCDIRFNDTYTFNTFGYDNIPAHIYDLQTVALHEFGHWLYIDDNYSDTNVVMYHLHKHKIRTLSSGEINEIRELYPKLVINPGGCSAATVVTNEDIEYLFDRIRDFPNPDASPVIEHIRGVWSSFEQTIFDGLASDPTYPEFLTNYVQLHADRLNRMVFLHDSLYGFHLYDSLPTEMISPETRIKMSKINSLNKEIKPDKAISKKEIDETIELIDKLTKCASEKQKKEAEKIKDMIRKTEGKTLKEVFCKKEKDEESHQKNEYGQILGNFPNPFNPATNIQYQLMKNSFVQLKIFDMLGREVKALINRIQEPGIHTETFNAGDLSSGTYFYRLKLEPTDGSKPILLNGKVQLIK